MVKYLSGLAAAAVLYAFNADVAWAGTTTVPIPEPSTLSLFAAGAAAAIWWRSRSKK